MKFAKYLAAESVPEWHSKYINYKLLKKIVKKISSSQAIYGSNNSRRDSEEEIVHIYEVERYEDFLINDILVNSFKGVIEHQGLEYNETIEMRLLIDKAAEEKHHKFFEQLNLEVIKVNRFYSERENDALKKMKVLKEQLELYLLMKRENTFANKKKEQSAIRKLKKAFMEYYRLLQFIQTYCVLNYTAVVKALKKFDKTAGWKSSPLYLSQRQLLGFNDNPTIHGLMSDTENMFLTLFEGKIRRSDAMNELRVPNEKGTFHFTTFRIGAYISFGISLLIPAVRNLIIQDQMHILSDETSLLIQIYAGFSIPVFFSILFAGNLYGWTRANVNYKFIFELDPRDNISFIQFFEFGSFFFLMWSTFCHLTFCDPFDGLDTIMKPFYPLMFLGISIVILMLPHPFFYWSSRKWLLITFTRVISSPYFPVEFRDFFLADEFCSLIYFISSLQVATCFYLNIFESNRMCSINTSFLSPAINMLPAYFRFVQCWRRFYDTKNAHPHITNAGKYFFVICSSWTSSWFSIYRTNTALAFWIILATIGTIYAYCWDVWFDWGFFQKRSRNKFLRNNLFYDRKWTYYFAIVSNFFLRITWTLLVSVGLWGQTIDTRALVYLVAVLEILRRFQWNFFRLENEHMNNCGEYRVVKEIPQLFDFEKSKLNNGGNGRNKNEDEDDKSSIGLNSDYNSEREDSSTVEICV